MYLHSDGGGFSMQKKNRSKRFLYGVLFLSVSNVLTKFCGLCLRVPLTNTLGDTGMAYFNLAYAVYKWFYMISTAGLPVAAAILTARYAEEDDRLRAVKQRRVRNVTLAAFVVLGILGALCMWFGAPLFAYLQHAGDAQYAIAAIAPALFCICVASALRGWYQGLECQLPASIAQVAEAAGKLVCGLWFGGYAVQRGYPVYITAAYAVAGLSVGTCLGMAVMLISHPFVVRRYAITKDIGYAGGHWRALLRELAVIALPVTLSASVMSLSDMLDSMTVIRRLCSAGIAHDEALRLYGSYTALAVPMFNLPPIIIYPITTALIPVISAARDDSEKCRRIIRTSLSFTAMIGLPCAAGMSVMAEPLLRLLYRSDLAKTAAPLLSVLALAVFFLCMLAMSNAILQAIGAARYPLRSMLLGAAVKFVSAWILCGYEKVGILGMPISTVLCYLTMAVCNLYYVMRASGAAVPFARLLIRPALAALLCAIGARAAYGALVPHLLHAAAVLLSVGIGGVTYLAALIALGGIDRELLSLIPGRTANRSVDHKTSGALTEP